MKNNESLGYFMNNMNHSKIGEGCAKNSKKFISTGDEIIFYTMQLRWKRTYLTEVLKRNLRYSFVVVMRGLMVCIVITTCIIIAIYSTNHPKWEAHFLIGFHFICCLFIWADWCKPEFLDLILVKIVCSSQFN